jgi:hypothetical protein
MKRFTVQPISDENWVGVEPIVLSDHATVVHAKAAAAEVSGAYQYGVAIVDNEYSEIDFGLGFGGVVPDY